MYKDDVKQAIFEAFQQLKVENGKWKVVENNKLLQARNELKELILAKLMKAINRL